MSVRYWTLKRPSVNAFDTETRHGNLLILCDPSDCLEIGLGTQFGHILNFLWSHGRQENFFWNVGYDLGAILKAHIRGLTAGQRKAIRDSHVIEHGKYKLTFLGDKGFRVRNSASHREKNYWDLAPLYSEENSIGSLDEVAKEKLGEGKAEGVDRGRLGQEPGYFEAHHDQVIEYCKRDALLTRRLAEIRLTEIQHVLGFYPARYSSKASLSKAYLDHHYRAILACPVPTALDEAFHKGFHGGIFHTRILGRTENVTEIDISSAYPSVIAELPDLRLLTPRVSNEFHEDAVLGVYSIQVEYMGDLPLVRRKGKRTVYPISRGPRPYWAAHPELRYLTDLGRPFHVNLAYEYFGPSQKAFSGMEQLYWRRQALRKDKKTEDLAFLLKVVMSACYGVFAESKHGETPFTNWVYAAMITGAVRARIWSLCNKIGWERVVSINTDSIRFIGPCPWYEANRVDLTRPGFGAWEEKFVGATTTHYQSGITLIEEKGKPPKVRRRGFKNLTPELLKGATGHRLEVDRSRPIKLLESLAQDRVEALGDFQEEERVLELQSNLHALDFPIEKLVFEYLNRFPLEGSNPDYDEVALPRRDPKHLPDKAGTRLRGQGGRNKPSH